MSPEEQMHGRRRRRDFTIEHVNTASWAPGPTDDVRVTVMPSGWEVWTGGPRLTIERKLTLAQAQAAMPPRLHAEMVLAQKVRVEDERWRVARAQERLAALEAEVA